MNEFESNFSHFIVLLSFPKIDHVIGIFDSYKKADNARTKFGQKIRDEEKFEKVKITARGININEIDWDLIDEI